MNKLYELWAAKSGGVYERIGRNLYVTELLAVANAITTGLRIVEFRGVILFEVRKTDNSVVYAVGISFTDGSPNGDWAVSVDDLQAEAKKRS